MIETVGIPVDDDNKGSSRLTACVSSQVRPGHYIIQSIDPRASVMCIMYRSAAPCVAHFAPRAREALLGTFDRTRLLNRFSLSLSLSSLLCTSLSPTVSDVAAIAGLGH